MEQPACYLFAVQTQAGPVTSCLGVDAWQPLTKAAKNEHNTLTLMKATTSQNGKANQMEPAKAHDPDKKVKNEETAIDAENGTQA